VTRPTRLLRGGDRLGGRLGWAVFDVAVAILFVVPVSLVLLLEGVILGNRMILVDDADVVASDIARGVMHMPPVPGTPVPDPGAADVEAFSGPDERRALALRYAPVILLATSHRPEWDIPVSVDFDGNWEPRDNPAALERIDSVPAVVYGELTAVTEDAFYLTYTLYRVRDYDHPLRQRISRMAHHDSDNEGFHVRVNRETGRVESLEAWFHNRFVLCNRSGLSSGTAAVEGRLHLEGYRPIIYSQSRGHGVRCAQSADLDGIDRLKVLRPSLTGRADVPRADRTGESDLRYRLAGFSAWYARAAEPDSRELFADTIRLTPDLIVGHYIAGLDREDVGYWARPKPMWAWDDPFDTVPVAVWHLLPSFSFEAHEGVPTSHDYLFNAPARAVFGITGNELRYRMDVQPVPPSEVPVVKSLGVIGRYITRVFMALG